MVRKKTKKIILISLLTLTLLGLIAYRVLLVTTRHLFKTVPQKAMVMDFFGFDPKLVNQFSDQFSNGKLFIIGASKQLYIFDLKTGKIFSEYRGNHFFSSFHISQDQLFFVNQNNALQAVDLKNKRRLWAWESGSKSWEKQPDSSIGPLSTKDLIIIWDQDDNLYGIDRKSGKTKWKVKTAGMYTGEHNQHIGLNDQVLIFNGRDKYIHALDLTTGEELWKKELYIFTKPLIIDNKALILSSNDLIAADLKTGKTVWKFQKEWPRLSYEFATYNNKVFVLDEGGTFLTIDITSGNVISELNLKKMTYFSTTSSLKIIDGVIYILLAGRPSSFHAIDAISGKKLWSFNIPGMDNYSKNEPIGAGDFIVFSHSETLYGLNKQNGNLIWSFEPGNNIASSPYFLNDKIYFASTQEHLFIVFTLDSKTGKKLKSLKLMTPENTGFFPH